MTYTRKDVETWLKQAAQTGYEPTCYKMLRALLTDMDKARGALEFESKETHILCNIVGQASKQCFGQALERKDRIEQTLTALERWKPTHPTQD